MYPISAEYIAKHGISEIETKRLLTEVVIQTIEAVSADITTDDIVSCIDVAVARYT